MTNATTKMGLGKNVLTKSTADGTAFVSFRVLSNNMVRVYSYATWTDYTVDQTVPRAEARAAWSRLKGEGYKLHTDDRCSFLPRRIECAA